MKFIIPLLDFWKKDIINKLIVVVLLVLTGGVFVFGWMILNMPQGKSLSEAFADILPGKQAAVPTLGFPTTPTPAANEIPFYLPTFTPPPLMPTEPPTPVVELPTPVVELPTPTLEPLPTLALASPTQQVLSTAQPLSGEAGCIPKNPPQTGRVVEVLDGNTLRVLIDKLIYVVRYTGVDAPKDKTYADAATAENKKLVYGKEITMIVDASDKDPRGRLLRYVMQGSTFVNLTMIQQGLSSALSTPPDSACAQAFKQAEQAARSSMFGIWIPTATPKSP
jgi:endonuclease YncB( thermonuclease family)